jgi:spore germination cell wall hydrolase CwlJ-like protein
MQEDIDILARTIYGESRGEYKKTGISAFIAIGNVVMNRLNFPQIFGSSVRKICLKPYQFSCWLVNDPNYSLIKTVETADSLFALCLEVAAGCVEKKYPDLTHGSDHYHPFMDTLPYWALSQKPKIILGHHLFYQLKTLPFHEN